MDPRRHLLRNGWITLAASFALAALLALPGRAGAQQHSPYSYPSVGPISGIQALGLSGSAPHIVGSFTDYFNFSVVPSPNFDMSFSFLSVNAFQTSFTSISLYAAASPNGAGFSTGPAVPLALLYSNNTPGAGISLGNGPFQYTSGNYLLEVIGVSSATNSFYSGALTFNNTAPIPEPETYAMMLAGLGLMGFVAQRRKQKQAV